jgi:hypothetical protein
VRAFAHDGSPLWAFTPNNASKQALALVRAGRAEPWVLVCGGLDRKLHALDPLTGQLRAEIELARSVNHLAVAAGGPDAPPLLVGLSVQDTRYEQVRWDGRRLVRTATRVFPPHADTAHGIANRMFRAYTLDCADLDGDGSSELIFGGGYTQASKVLVHDQAGAERAVTEAWSGPDTPGLERTGFYHMTLVRTWRPRADPSQTRILALTTGCLRMFDAAGRLLGESAAPVGFCDLAVDGDTLYLGSSPNGDSTVYRIDLAGDWRARLAGLQRQGLAQRMGETLATILRQAQELPEAPGRRAPAVFSMGRVVTGRSEGAAARAPNAWFRERYPYPQFADLPANSASGMVSGPRENVLLGPDGRARGPRSDGRPRDEFVDMARAMEASGCDQTFYVSHGCDPRATVGTLDAMLAAAPRHLRGFVVHEDEQAEHIPGFARGFLAPLAERCVAREAQIFAVEKNVWWFETPALDGVGETLFRPSLAPAIVAGSDDANSRTPELNLMARFGLRQSGLIGHIMSCPISDLLAFNRTYEWEYAKHGHPFFRLLVVHTALGADHYLLRGNNVYREKRPTAEAAEAWDPFLHLLGKGWLFAPSPEQMAGICPVGLVVHQPPPAWTKDAHNGHGVNEWRQDPVLDNAVLPHNGTIWGNTPTPAHALTAVLFRKQRQFGHIPATPYGPVAMVPAHADRSRVAGVHVWWHTDGVAAWRENGPRLTGTAAADALRADLEAAAVRLPFRPLGDDVFFHAITTEPGVYRLVAVDPGWLDPADRDIRVRIQVPGAFRIRDLLDESDVPVADGAFALRVPAGAFRLLEARRR